MCCPFTACWIQNKKEAKDCWFLCLFLYDSIIFIYIWTYKDKIIVCPR